MKRVLCIGEALIDFIAEKQGSDLSKARLFTRKAGGAPANVACAIAKLGGRSSFVGSVGEDPFGNYLVNTLKDHGVDTSLVQQVPTFTTMAFVSLAEDGERDFVFNRGADRELVYKPSIKVYFADNILHLGAATALLGGNLEDAYGHYFFDALTENSFICFDPNFRSDLWKNREKDFIKKCMPYIQKSNLCKFSLDEALLLSGKKDLESAANRLHEEGVAIITVTLGPKGTFLSMAGESKTVPTIKVKPVDTTGAGDAFIGCLLYQLSKMDTLEGLEKNVPLITEMVSMANKAGALTTTRYGAIESLPDLDQLQSNS